MPARSSWKGHLRLSLVSVPVQAFNAEVGGTGDAGVQLHQLHAECHNRIQYKKVCPVHGEISQDEIVMGYEHTKGHYVVVDKEEAKRLKGDGEKTIDIETFIEPDAIDPIYYDGRTYYLTPDGSVGEKPYAVLLKAMEQEKRYGVGLGNFWGKERLVIVRPLGSVLCLEMLHFASSVRPASAVAPEEQTTVSKEEMRLASKLIEASSSDRFDLAKYEDQYAKGLKELIAAKVDENEVVAAPKGKEPPVINLMDALRRSVDQSRKPAAQRASTRGTPKTAGKRASTRHAG